MNPSPPYGIETQLFSPDLASAGHICLGWSILIVIIYNLQNQTETLCVCTTYGEMAHVRVPQNVF